MKLKNISARGHWVGDVLIAPLETKDVGDEWRSAYNRAELQEVRDDEVVIEPTEVIDAPKRGRKPKTETVTE